VLAAPRRAIRLAGRPGSYLSICKDEFHPKLEISLPSMDAPFCAIENT
jgi:hypothetical protein